MISWLLEGLVQNHTHVIFFLFSSSNFITAQLGPMVITDLRENTCRPYMYLIVEPIPTIFI